VKNYLIGISIVLIFILFIPQAEGEQQIIPIKDKYTITKNAAWFWESTETIQIDLIDLRSDIELQKGKSLDIIISDFIPTSKGRLSNANDILSGRNIILSEIENHPNVLGERIKETKSIPIINLEENLTKFSITTDTIEKDTATYSGKIYLKNESISVPIDVDIVIKHHPLELIIFNFIGITLGIVSAIVITKGWCSKWNKDFFGAHVEFNNSKGPWMLVVLTTIIGIPSSLLVNNLFIGSVGWDIAIALGIGFLILVSLLKEKENETEFMFQKKKLGKKD